MCTMVVPSFLFRYCESSGPVLFPEMAAHTSGALRTGSRVVCRARPLLSLTGSWGRGVGKAREGLADVISIHELLANQILLPSFGVVVTREDYAFAK